MRTSPQYAVALVEFAGDRTNAAPGIYCDHCELPDDVRVFPGIQQAVVIRAHQEKHRRAWMAPAHRPKRIDSIRSTSATDFQVQDVHPRDSPDEKPCHAKSVSRRADRFRSAVRRNCSRNKIELVKFQLPLCMERNDQMNHVRRVKTSTENSNAHDRLPEPDQTIDELFQNAKSLISKS